MPLIPTILITLGLGLLLVTVWRTQRLIGILYEQGQWASLRNLLIFFAAGYAAYLVLPLLRLSFDRELIVAEVFFLAALFMFLVVRFSFTTIYGILRLDAVEQQRNLDPVTELFSRDAIHYLFNHEFWKAQRFGFPLSMALVGVDGLDEIQEAGGGEAVDTALKKAAERLKEDLRGGDLIGRTDRDEFLCILPTTSESGSLITAERLRGKVRAVRLITTEEGGLTLDPRPDQFREGLQLTASVGLVTLDTGMSTPGAALEAAREALQRVRRQGGNRVVGPPETPPDQAVL